MLWAGCALSLTLGVASASGTPQEGEGPEGLRPPRALDPIEVAYPAEAGGVAGSVRLDLLITETGSVAEARVLAAPHPALARAARDGVKRLRFDPALEDGSPIPVRVEYTVRFEAPLAGAASPVARAPKDAAGAPAREVPRAPDEPPRSTASEPDAVSEDEAYAVTVTRRRPRRSATDFVLEVDAETFPQSPTTSGADLLRRAPGVYISQHSGQGKGHQIFLRGFDAVHGQDIEVTAGGIPVNEVSNIHAQGYVDLHFIIPEAVRRIRVLEGAFDPRQGDFAVAGSIDFDLGLEREGLFARSSVGQFGLLRAVVGWRPEGAPPETFAAAELARASGFGPARAWNRASFLGQAALELPQGFTLTSFVGSHAGRFDSAGVVRLDDYQAGRLGRFDTYDAAQGGGSERHQVRLALEQERRTSRTELSVYAVLREFRLRSNFTGFLLDEAGDRFEQEQSTTTFGASGTFGTKIPAVDLGLEVGIEARHDRTERSQARLRALDGALVEEELDDRLAITDLGLFVDLDWLPLSWLQLRGGVRIEALSYLIDERLAEEGAGSRREAFGYHVAPKATAEVVLAPPLRLYASYGNGFRSPQATSLGQGERTPLTVVDAGELGARFERGGLELVGAGFVTHVEEDLVFDHATGQNLLTGATLRYGGAARLVMHAGEALHAALAVTYTRAEKPGSGDQVPFVPPLVAQADLEARNTFAELAGQPLFAFGRVGLTGLGPRPLPFSETGEPVFLVEAGLGLEWRALVLSVEAFNLLDLEWRDSEFVYASDFRTGPGRSAVPARHFTAGRPLTVQATLTVRLEDFP